MGDRMLDRYTMSTLCINLLDHLTTACRWMLGAGRTWSCSLLLAGTILALVGASGSGKTTLAQHFNALLKPSQGFTPC